ncbi:sugar phosphate isomerase/epimerase family protein [Saccharibacillus alkalitolerans]|uniref:Sugar phosphate isomerase/epimerase n=1 Tax=Saccharibacillus alkalitolerans TaxID=2705290 RepID=A0ABX0F7C1_9BACL|nr:sugar phosphate isomerase/epimerase family protein [Saccharibacillus alkalitolerans]NGZ76852.1 sugar phosphate isomerase/epimerase [Saccharibacillus alkalitolerans]
MKLGISSYSLYQAMQQERMKIEEVLDWAAGIGASHVEIVPDLGFGFGDDPGLEERLVRRARELSLEISNYAIRADFTAGGEEEYEAEIRRVMSEVDRANRLGAGLMRHDVAFREDTSILRFNEDLDMLASACRRIADHASQYGIVTSVENHGYYVQASDRIQALVHAVGRPNFRTTLDVGNFVCVDEDPLSAVRNNLPIASMVHIKDFYIRPARLNPGEGWFRSAGGSWLRGAIAGQGDLDLVGIIALVKDSGYDGFLSIEYEGMEDCLEGTRIAFDNVRRIWDESRERACAQA